MCEHFKFRSAGNGRLIYMTDSISNNLTLSIILRYESCCSADINIILSRVLLQSNHILIILITAKSFVLFGSCQLSCQLSAKEQFTRYTY